MPVSTPAELVDQLFKTHRRPDGKEYSNAEVARAMREHGGEIDPSYLAKVRRGEIKNPGREALKQLCVFFNVPATYFFPELDPVQQSDLSPDEQVRLALRAAGLDAEERGYLEGLIRSLRERRQEG